MVVLESILSRHDELKSANFRHLLAHWLECRTSKEVPQRSAIDPSKLRKELANIVILDWQEPSVLQYRLVGTEIENRLDFTATGMNLFELIGESSELFLKIFVDQICNKLCGGYIEYFHEHNERKLILATGLFLPLSDDNETINILIGAVTGASNRDIALYGPVQSLMVKIDHIEFVDLGFGLPPHNTDLPNRRKIDTADL